MKLSTSTLLYLLIICSCTRGVKDSSIDEIRRAQIFERNVISYDSIEEASPSMTKDGSQLVFTRSTQWKYKVPYLATKVNATWQVEKVPVIDTVYNIAISPSGSKLFYHKKYIESGIEKSKSLIVTKTNGKWGTPRSFKHLEFNNAGYFYPLANGSLYMYINDPEQPGIYKSTLQKDDSYSQPEWVSNLICPNGSITFDAIVNETEDKMLVTRSKNEIDSNSGTIEEGVYYHRKINDKWDSGTLVNDLPYSWGLTVTSDDQLLFVYEEDIKFIRLADLNIEW